MRAFAQAPSAGTSTHGNRSTLPIGLLAAILACAVAFLGIGAPAASAAPEAGPGWSFRNSFGNVDGQVFDNPRNPIAVDGNGNIVIVEEAFATFRVYSPGGEQLTSYFAPPALPRNIAVDASDDTVYVDELAVFGGTVITRYTSDGQPTPTYTLDPGFQVPQGEGIAVDPTSSDLLVADPGAEGVRRYDTTGASLGTIGTPGIAPAWLVTLPDGSFLVAPAEGADVTHFSGTGTKLGVLSGVGQLHGLAFDSAQSLVVASVGDTIKTYSLAGNLRSESPAKGSNGIGLAVDGASEVLYEHGRNTVNAYVPAIVPGVEAPVVSDITADSAHLSVELDPGAGPPEGSAARFEYSEDGGANWTPLPDQPVSGPETIEADLTGITLNWDFLVRVKAFNSLASKTSAAAPFSTPEIAPLVETGVAAERTETGAVLNGTVNPAGLQTSYHFEYGTTAAYGSRVPLANELPAGNQRKPRSVSAAIDGLQPGTTYHYRLVAENAIGETNGDDKTFTTITPAEAFPQRAYEQVTPVDKRGAQVASEFHVQLAPDGSWIAAATASGSSDSEANRMRQNFLIRRGTSDWSDWTPIDAPQQATVGIFESSTTGVSPDGTHALVASNRDLAPGGIAGGGNLYDKDLLTGEYTFVAGAPGYDAYNQLANGLANEKIYMGGAPDFSWILFRSSVSLSPEAPGAAIYRWTRGGGLSIESQIPDSFNPGQTMVSGDIQMPGAYQLSFPSSSADGSVVAFGATGGVFRRANGVTTALSVSRRAEDEGTQYPAALDGLSADGRYVLFHSPFHLTDDTPEDIEGHNAGYLYDAQNDTLTFTLPVEASEPMVGMSQDAHTAYYDTTEDISVWHDGDVHQVTTEHPIGNAGAYYTTQTGRYFAFIDRNKRAHFYDLGIDETTCVSCPADGSTPNPAWIGLNARTIGNTQPRVITEDGTMFFDTASQLVSADLNGRRDVYAYKDGRYALISPGDDTYDAVFVGATDDGQDVFFQTDQGLVSRDVDGNTDVYDARVGGGFASQNPPPAPASCVRSGCEEMSGGPVASPSVSSQAVIAHKSPPTKRCKKGYVKKKVKGQQRCVKKQRHKKHKQPARHTRASGK